ncbi:MAG TPA: hypothetical protein V6D06_10110 [Trichocoleus sp.]
MFLSAGTLQESQHLSFSHSSTRQLDARRLEPRQQRNREVKKVGVQYWRRLHQNGIPLLEARQIAAAIAKFDVAKRPPTGEQAALIIRYSPLICRAQLWRRDLLPTSSLGQHR